MSVATIFKEFCNNLKISLDKRTTISSRYNSICKRLNKDFWNMDTTHGGRYVGSYGRETANSWVSDIDMLFEMPTSLYNRFNNYNGNGQSTFLQIVKDSIKSTYPTTSLSGDGQIVKVEFSDSMYFEVLPVFKNDDNSYTFANSNNGGSWKNTNPIPEIEAIKEGDKETNNNLKRLCRMVRAWKYYCDVSIPGLLIDTLAYQFLTNWSHKKESFLYYDWMSRDFFKYLSDQKKDQYFWLAVGSNQCIYPTGNFAYKAKIAYNKSLENIENQKKEYWWTAKQTWREIYGNRFPE